MEDLREIVKDILEKGYVATVAFADDHGIWASDVLHVCDDDLSIYWMASPHARRSRALENEIDVAGTITVDAGRQKPNYGVQFIGTARRLNDSRHDLVVKHCVKRGYPEPKEGEGMFPGSSWYVLTPKKFDVICEEKWGFEKKTLDM